MKTTLLKIAILSLLVNSCEMYDSSAQYNYQVPDSLSDGFDVGTLDEIDINTRLIEEAVSKIYGGQYAEVHSMLIHKDGLLVLDEYFPGHEYQWDAPYYHGEWIDWDISSLHVVQSVTKSITSTLIGIAIDEGFIESVDQSIFDYLPEHQSLNTRDKGEICIEHLVTMTSGLDWDEWSSPIGGTKNDISGIWFQDKDPLTFILERPLVNKPGTKFTYSGGNMIVLGEIIRNASNLPIDEFAEMYLFDPLEIDSTHWALRFENDVIESAGGLRLSPRAMAKIGVTLLNGGIWNGNRVVSEAWIERSAKTYFNNSGINIPGEPSGRLGYSHGWWTKQYTESGNTIHMYAAGGWGGQNIMVLPEVNTVVVFTGGNYVGKRPPYKILEKYIIPAIVD